MTNASEESEAVNNRSQWPTAETPVQNHNENKRLS